MWALLFPGQGSQSLGMGRFFFDNFESARRLFEEASDLLSLHFEKLLFEGPEADLALTANTQPALLLVSTAADRVFKEIMPLTPTAAAGHSLGEYSALVSTGALSFADALRSVRIRGEAMQAAVPVGQGGMLAVLGASDDQVELLCKWVEATSGLKPLEPANYNSPGQVVVSGSLAAIEWCRKNFSVEASGLSQKPKFIPLNVSAPFHCSMMKPAQERMAEVLNALTFSHGHFSVVQNYNARATRDAVQLKLGLIEQVTAPVRWTQGVNQFKEMGINRFIEVGSGRVLTGLLKKIDSENLKTFNVQNLEDLKALEKEVLAK